MKPLGLPEGSVRAIIVLGALFAVVFPVFIFVFRSTDIPQGVKEILIYVAGVASGLMKDYLNTRKSEPAEHEVKQ